MTTRGIHQRPRAPSSFGFALQPPFWTISSDGGFGMMGAQPDNRNRTAEDLAYRQELTLHFELR